MLDERFMVGVYCIFLVLNVSKLTVPLLEGVFVLEVVFKVVSTDSCLCVQLHLHVRSKCSLSQQ